MTRMPQIPALALLSACWLGTLACSSSNAPTPVDTSGGAPASGGAVGSVNTAGGAPTGGAGGPSAMAGSAAASAGAAGTLSSGGASASAGGSDGLGGVAGGGVAGTTGAGTGGAQSGMFSPLCVGATATKGGLCTPTDTQLCYKTCGPQSLGFKSETCTGGTYKEQSGCSYATDFDATCYKVPATIDPSCPGTPPVASAVCTVSACTPCNMGGNYLEAGGTGTPKAGFCVCASGKWSCASTTAWPCPGANGC